MTPRALEQFLALAQTLHFGRASELASISLSALSRNIRQLEEDVGVALFTRDNRSVALTAQGVAFEIYARDALAGWAAIRRELGDSSGLLQGEISLYCSVTASYSILYELLNRFRPDHPGIEIQLSTGDPEHAISTVLAGEADLCIAARPGSLPRALAFKPIMESPLVFIAPGDTGDADIPAAVPVDLSQWANIPMILSAGGIARNRIDAWFKTIKIKPRIYAQVAGNEAIVSMVSLGLGVGVVPKIVLDNSPLSERVRVLSVKPELQPYELGLIVVRKNLENPLVKAFWAIPTGSSA